MSKCSVCDAKFDLNSEGGTEGSFGILPVSFCPTCLTSCLDMADQFRNPTNDFSESAWNESERPSEPDVIHSQGILNRIPSENPDASWLQKKECLTPDELNASND